MAYLDLTSHVFQYCFILSIHVCRPSSYRGHLSREIKGESYIVREAGGSGEDEKIVRCGEIDTAENKTARM